VPNDLSVVIDAWHRLPDAIRIAIVALVHAANLGRTGS
jgi:hypothetical protein